MDTAAACRSYAQDNDDADGKYVTVTTTEDIDEHFEYTADRWEDGSPVAKMFERNEAIPLHIPAGTTLHGVSYTGRASGSQIFEFMYGRAWYRAYATDDDVVFGVEMRPVGES